MSKPTEIIHDAKAFVTSTTATVAGAAATVVALAAAVVVLIPDQYSDIKAKIVAVGAAAAVVGGAARQLYAWLDPKNTAFGNVHVEVDPGEDQPGDAGPAVLDEPAIEVPVEEPVEANEPDLTQEEIDAPADVEEGAGA
jgi:hypothetical protein